jgi:RNA recognition motif-containing protein
MKLENDMLDNNEKSGSEPIATLFVDNMSILYTKQIVLDLFHNFGTVNNVDIIQGSNEPKIFTGFGFVTFETVEEATNAKTSLHGFKKYGRKLR